MNMAMSQARIEISTSVELRQRFAAAQNMRLVDGSNRPGMALSHVSQNHDSAPSQLVSAAAVRALRKRVRERQRVPGIKTIDNEILGEVELPPNKKSDIVFCDCFHN